MGAEMTSEKSKNKINITNTANEIDREEKKNEIKQQQQQQQHTISK